MKQVVPTLFQSKQACDMGHISVPQNTDGFVRTVLMLRIPVHNIIARVYEGREVSNRTDTNGEHCWESNMTST